MLSWPLINLCLKTKVKCRFGLTFRYWHSGDILDWRHLNLDLLINILYQLGLYNYVARPILHERVDAVWHPALFEQLLVCVSLMSHFCHIGARRLLVEWVVLRFNRVLELLVILDPWLNALKSHDAVANKVHVGLTSSLALLVSLVWDYRR